jgi:catabolite regulation protein CreA
VAEAAGVCFDDLPPENALEVPEDLNIVAQKLKWVFENPSNTSIACQRSGPLDLSRARLRKSGEEVFSQRQSLFFKDVAVRRILDVPNRSILYVSYSRQVVEGSAKMSLSSVMLTDEDLATLTGKAGQPSPGGN